MIRCQEPLLTTRPHAACPSVKEVRSKGIASHNRSCRRPSRKSAQPSPPDGRHVAYASDESGRSEIYVRAYPTGGRWQISTNGGFFPHWGRDGREIFYYERARMMRVDVQPGPAFKVGEPRSLFGADVGFYDVAPVGQRFLVVRPAREEAGPSQLHVVVNWFDELQQKVAVAGRP